MMMLMALAAAPIERLMKTMRSARQAAYRRLHHRSRGNGYEKRRPRAREACAMERTGIATGGFTLSPELCSTSRCVPSTACSQCTADAFEVRSFEQIKIQGKDMDVQVEDPEGISKLPA
jgi:hypothetical protein